MKKINLTVIIPVYNEEKNISNAINSIKEYVDQIIIVDSASNDNTISIAKKCYPYIDVINIPFINWADKMNKAFRHPIVRNNWLMRLDADEIVIEPDTFFETLKTAINNTDKTGFYIMQRFYFLNHWVRHGGYPRQVLRIWQKDKAFYEDRLLDEKMILQGTTGFLNLEIADKNQKGFKNWFKKHINYAKSEAAEAQEIHNKNIAYDLEFDRKNFENKKKYYKLPIFIRPLLYFLHRLIVQNGWKDGIIGLFYHFLHAFVYREMVDYRIMTNKLKKS